MPYRSATLTVPIVLLGLMGLLAVGVLALMRADLHEASRTGPRWKRSLVAAGLLLLAWGGWGCGGRHAQAVPNTTATTAATQTELRDTDRWKRLTATWREAEEVASGQRGAYPFDQAGKTRLLKDLETAGTDVDALQREGLLTEPEAGLLKADLKLLTEGVQAKRPTELQMATCYSPMMWQPGRDSLTRLQQRLPLLERLADARTLQPEVVTRVLVTVERELGVLKEERNLATLSGVEQEEAREVARKVTAQVEKLRERMKSGSTAALETREWQTVVAAWRAAEPLARAGQSTTAQREQADKGLKGAAAAATRLVAVGAMGRAEADLLQSEAERLRSAIYASPPTDSTATCYGASPMGSPTRSSLERLAQRLPLLERLGKEGKMQQAVLEKLMPSLEEDLKTLSQANRASELSATERVRAEELQREIRATLANLERLLGAGD